VSKGRSSHWGVHFMHHHQQQRVLVLFVLLVVSHLQSNSQT
jgi:hypothetical protein